MRMNLDTWLVAILFLVPFEFDYCLLAIGSKYDSNKGMPAAVPIRRKTCERCDLVF